MRSRVLTAPINNRNLKDKYTSNPPTRQLSVMNIIGERQSVFYYIHIDDIEIARLNGRRKESINGQRLLNQKIEN